MQKNSGGMTRQENSVKNAKISFFSHIALLLLTFFSRKIFIDTLGDEIVGLNSTMINILNFVNLSELGIGTAVSTSLYQPLYHKEEHKINDIISILGYLYRIIGLVVIGIGLILAAAIPFMFEGKGVDLPWVYIAFGAFFTSNLVAYFISYQQTLLTADQKYYVVVSTTNKSIIAKVILQIVALKWFGAGYGTWLVIEVVFSILFGLWINHKVKQCYPWLQSSIRHGKEIRKEYKYIFKKARQVIPHRISGSILTQTDNIVLLLLTSLETVTYYTNYYMLMSKSVTLISTSFNGTGASVGHLIAQGNKESVKKLFWEFQSLFFIIASVFSVCFYLLASPFVLLWLGPGYVLGDTIVGLFCINTFLSIMRIPMIHFTNGYSLFKDTWAPWCEAGINLVLSIALGYYWGMSGIMIGTAVSLGFMFIWKPYFFYREIFRENVLPFWFNMFKYTAALAVAFFAASSFSQRVLPPDYSGFGGLVLSGFGLFVFVLVVETGCMWCLDSNTRILVRRLINIIGKMRRK